MLSHFYVGNLSQAELSLKVHSDTISGFVILSNREESFFL